MPITRYNQIQDMVVYFNWKVILVGTLMANWWEENELKKANGQARTTTMYHLQKNHEQLFPNIASKKIDIPTIARDNT